MPASEAQSSRLERLRLLRCRDLAPEESTGYLIEMGWSLILYWWQCRISRSG
ncbi:Unknown protein sequence [Pseudomonas amygdali pv. dendropanacis]|uniref:Uncharacterized protein n=1 Tax=Pseudomonas amygdali pv. dendropanacis TaxID=235272 RepID=A0A0P9SBN3_PSEA0|nr:hypothetical protein [Pseudomonas amygdali]KPX23589.1 Unknown protein sequence [Pseudomonas amygdali pv. dendropanacis]